MSKLHTQLIEKFKTLESLVREHYGQSIYEFEQTMDESEQKKMQLIRLQRNYIQHENDFDAFVTVSEKQMQFLDTLIKRIQLEDGCAKDAMVSVAKFGVCDDCEPIGTVIKVLCVMKQGQVLITNTKTGEAIGFVDANKLAQMIFVSGRLADKISNHKKLFDTDFTVTEQSVPLRELEQMDCNKFVVTNKNKKVVGVVLYD